MLRPITLLAVGLVFLEPLRAAAPPGPPPPDVYGVTIRYRIAAFPKERVAQFNEMMKALAARGFRRDPNDRPGADEAANPNATLLRGTVPAAKARSLLLERHVRCILLVPAGAKLPEDANQPVRVSIELADGLPPDRQGVLHAQTAEALAAVKFAEAVGYDDRGATRLVGSVPAGQVEALLNDFRRQPSGRELPPPFSGVHAVRIVEARPDLPVPAPRPAAPAVAPELARVADDFRALLAEPAQAGKRTRFEVLLAAEPQQDERAWLRAFRAAAPGVNLEGRLGTLVTVTAPADQAPALAALPEVTGVRLPRAAQTVPVPADADEAAAAKALGLDRLHARGSRGQGVRIAVIGADFRGWQGLLGKGLPKGTTLIDLTRERNENLQPDPFPDGARAGQGTLFARAVSAAAPAAELVLIRVDPAAPYMLQTVARAVAGESTQTLALEQRYRDLQAEQDRLDVRRHELLEERARVFAELREEGEPLQRRQEYEERQAAFERDDADYHRRLGLYLDHAAALLRLKGVRVVASALVWDAGHSGGGSSALSRYLDERPFPGALWVQAAGSPRQAWNGLFRVPEGGGAMEFAPRGTPLPDGSWSPNLNFIAWQATGGTLSPELPAGTRVRLTFQWREPHDASLLHAGQDLYRDPTLAVRLLVLRQADPTGATRPADDLEVVAQTTGIARRLDHAAGSGSYEVSVEWRVPAAGRYAVRVEGKAPESDRPAGSSVLPWQRRVGEIRGRLVLETLDGDGRAVWRDFPGEGVSLGMPADARTVEAVVAAGNGALPRDDWSRKPDLVARPGVDGAGLAAALEAGAAASAGVFGTPECWGNVGPALRAGAVPGWPGDRAP